MDYAKCKIYYDGCNYIAIPYRPSPSRRHGTVYEELVDVVDYADNALASNADSDCNMVAESLYTATKQESHAEAQDNAKEPVHFPLKRITRKEIFEELFQENLYKKKSEKREIIISKMRPYFETVEETANYVNVQLDRKRRNAIRRRVRLTRKVNLQQDFDYFCTFTYDDKLHTEESFQKKFRDCLKKLCHRKGWKYIGVWERSPEKHRLHFHGLFYIPEGTMLGELMKVSDYSPVKGKVQHTIQNTYFNKRFGRSDFKPIDTDYMLNESLAYLMKYMEKTGEKIVCSKNLPQYFFSDIMDKDIVCDFGIEGRKKILMPNFTCWDYGEYIGQVSKETIAQLRKEN